MTDTASDNAPVPHRFRLETLSSIGELAGAEWNRLAGTGYPFLRHEFLLALEESGCTTVNTGWEPMHLVVYPDDAADSAPLALMPLYRKTNSFGEYVFDWSWADAYYRHGLEYYPKYVSAVPFTPCAGPRLCCASPADEPAVLAFLAEQVPRLARRDQASSWHILFPEQALSDALASHEILQRRGCQYQWFNEDFRDFPHFLEKFSSRKRKNIRKERRRIAESGIHFRRLHGREIDAGHWEQFYRFYQSTYFVRGRQPYLTPGFFSRLGESMPDALLMVLACVDGEPIAGALSLIGADTLYGRYWGCSEQYQFLHFETCYYQGIEYCIEAGLQRFDSGAQGEHKIQRGFEPVSTWSNHWIADPRFREAIRDFLREEDDYVERYQEHATDFLPFRQPP